MISNISRGTSAGMCRWYMRYVPRCKAKGCNVYLTRYKARGRGLCQKHWLRSQQWKEKHKFSYTPVTIKLKKTDLVRELRLRTDILLRGTLAFVKREFFDGEFLFESSHREILLRGRDFEIIDMGEG